jgi:hypothetical protein
MRPSRAPRVITDQMRRQTLLLATWGHTQADVAEVLEISEMTLKRRLADEFSQGAAQCGQAIAHNLKRIASDRSGEHVSATVEAAKFYLQCREGWQKTQRIIHGFDPSVVMKFVSQVVDAIKRHIPDTCPHCKTNLNLRPTLAGELMAMSKKLESSLPPAENVPAPPPQEPG